MIPWGPFHPDSAGINTQALIEAKNCLPGDIGFQSLPSAVGSTSALPDTCRGAVSVLLDDASVKTYAGTDNKLYSLSATGVWDDVSEHETVVDDFGDRITPGDGEAVVDDVGSVILAEDGSEVLIETDYITISGDDYSVGSGEQWKFVLYGDNLIATNIVDGPQKININSGTAFAALGGSPPAARYIDIVREFVFLGAVFGNEKRVQWSANGNSESWTVGTGESDYQDFPNGGPVRGLIGGETVYVFQAGKVTRGTYVPGSSFIFQFDEIEGAAGLASPHSLVRLRGDAYYLAPDGIRKLGLASAGSAAIGVKKWLRWFIADKKAGSDLTVLGAANPVRPIIVWAYVSVNNIGTTPDRLLIYDWSLDEATFCELSVEALVQWLSPGVTLDTMNDYGTMETLPFSLDSPFWRGGSQIMGLFTTDNKLSLQSGENMEATFITSDGMGRGRSMIKGVRPMIDSTQAQIAIAARERDGDSISFGPLESMEDTGICPAHRSGNLVRAKLVAPAGAIWTLAKGLDTIKGQQGSR